MTRITHFIVLALALSTCAAMSEKDILSSILKNYDNGFRPVGLNGTGPTVISVNTYVRSMDTIDDVKMEYKVQLTFRQQWVDPRLKYRHLDNRYSYITLAQRGRIWIPDTFFGNEKEGHLHDILMPNSYIRIFPDGDVLHSIRISLTLSCPMNLKKFPFDVQTCSMRLASYAFTTDDLVYIWKQVDPVQVTPDLHLPHFYLAQFQTDYCNSQTNTGIYSCLRVDFQLQREISYYLVQVFIPCTSLVIMAWLSFWLSKTEVVGRLLLTVMTYLIMMVGIFLLNVTLPKVSYTKSIDVWTGICLTFVSGALYQFILVNFLARREGDKGGVEVNRGNFKDWPLSEKIDVISRAAYPILFILFVCTYAAVYCPGKMGSGEI